MVWKAADLIRALAALPVALPVVGGDWEPELRSRCCGGDIAMGPDTLARPENGLPAGLACFPACFPPGLA